MFQPILEVYLRARNEVATRDDLRVLMPSAYRGIDAPRVVRSHPERIRTVRIFRVRRSDCEIARGKELRVRRLSVSRDVQVHLIASRTARIRVSNAIHDGEPFADRPLPAMRQSGAQLAI